MLRRVTSRVLLGNLKAFKHRSDGARRPADQHSRVWGTLRWLSEGRVPSYEGFTQAAAGCGE